MGEQPANFAETGRIGGITDDRVHVKLLGGDLEVAATSTYQGYFVAVIAEAFGYYAPQVGIAAGDQDLHCHDLLVLNLVPRPGGSPAPTVTTPRPPQHRYLGSQRVTASIEDDVTGQ